MTSHHYYTGPANDDKRAGHQRTTADLARLDPRIAALLEKAHSYYRIAADDEAFCRRAVFHGYPGWPHFRAGGLKRRVTELAGWERREGPAELQTEDAYDIVYDAVLYALPECWGDQCSCQWRDEAMAGVSPSVPRT
jgi:hypothetical protein